jgi:hypothetical protein
MGLGAGVGEVWLVDFELFGKRGKPWFGKSNLQGPKVSNSLSVTGYRTHTDDLPMSSLFDLLDLAGGTDEVPVVASIPDGLSPGTSWNIPKVRFFFIPPKVILNSSSSSVVGAKLCPKPCPGANGLRACAGLRLSPTAGTGSCIDAYCFWGLFLVAFFEREGRTRGALTLSSEKVGLRVRRCLLGVGSLTCTILAS